MNHIYRTLWSEALHAWVVVPETARAVGSRASEVIGEVGERHVSADAYRGALGRLKGLCTIAMAVCLWGASVEAWSQAAVVASGDVSPQGSGSAWGSSSTSFRVGDAGTGTLHISGGGSVTANSVDIGRQGGSDGSVTVTGVGSTLVVGKNLDVGNSGIGSLTIQGGAKVTSAQGYIGRQDGSKGTVIVNGIGSEWRTSSFLYVGNTGEARLEISGGGLVAATGVIDIGRNASLTPDTDVVLVTGAGSKMTTERSLNVGRSTGHGELTVTDYGQVISQEGYIGRETDSDGVVTVSNGGQWLMGEQLSIGFEGEGTLKIESGGVVRADTVTLGSQLKSLGGELFIHSGGALETRQIIKGVSGAKIEINGGILRATANQSQFFSGITDVNLGSDGLIFDTNGYDVGVQTNFIGTGKFIKNGAGTLSLDIYFDNSLNYFTETVLNAGVLVPLQNTALGSGNVTIGGAGAEAQLNINSGISIANGIEINAQGSLRGFGQVGNTVVNNGGLIEPGFDDVELGTLKINGDLNFGAGGTYYSVFQSGTDQSDLIDVSGAATLTGGILHHSGLDENYQQGAVYTVLKAATLNGQFSSVYVDYDFLDAEVKYDNNEVTIGLKRNSSKFSDFALTPNQKAVARALEQMNVDGRLDEYIETVPKGSAPAAFDSLSGEVHASVKGSLLGWGHHVAQTSLDELYEGMDSGEAVCSSEAQPSVKNHATKNINACSEFSPVWMHTVGDWARVKSDGNAAKSKNSTAGFLIGTEYVPGLGGWRVGAGLGYGSSSLHVHPRRSKADVHNYSVFGYAGKRVELQHQKSLNVMAGLAYTYHSLRTHREIPRVNRALDASYSGHTLQFFGDLSYQLGNFNGWKLAPFMGLNVASLSLDSFQESGGSASLQARSSHEIHSSATLGLRAKTELKIADKPVLLQGTVGWRRAVGSPSMTRTMSFNVGSPDFIIAGVPVARNTAVLSVFGQVTLSPSATLEAGFSGEFGRNVREQSVQAKLRWMF